MGSGLSLATAGGPIEPGELAYPDLPDGSFGAGAGAFEGAAAELAFDVEVGAFAQGSGVLGELPENNELVPLGFVDALLPLRELLVASDRVTTGAPTAV